MMPEANGASGHSTRLASASNGAVLTNISARTGLGENNMKNSLQMTGNLEVLSPVGKIVVSTLVNSLWCA